MLDWYLHHGSFEAVLGVGRTIPLGIPKLVGTHKINSLRTRIKTYQGWLSSNVCRSKVFPVSKQESHMELKPQDPLLLVKYWALKKAAQDSSVRCISELIGISASEVSKGTKRLMTSRLVVERSGSIFAESNALLEWLCYGVRYAYPLQSVGYGRGMVTSWNCPLLGSEMTPTIPPIVWPVSGGDTEGALIKPIHDSVPAASRRDENLYCVMSLLEAIRGGKPRELSIARDLLAKLIKGNS